MEQFDLCVDRKVTVWTREHHSVNAETQEEAVKILADACISEPLNGSANLESFTDNYETLVETEGYVEPTKEQATIEIVDWQNKEVFWSNKL